ncbi:hypothetical protein K503DRAFT_13335 [Rhizopogon vinicolor AM-OR11-026]|uniref:Swiss Army Knife RNA repair protein HAD domain-containing protein n=1 Tax=Rhizopogon vinicolor AM-OR11-026 TaxID=1314800 RepID=A0A1B7NJ16_9AGAM|nr:hypothetical protein K503DRAFT_13335 [Rhizopogon vinicolor AM-OR11-026]
MSMNDTHRVSSTEPQPVPAAETTISELKDLIPPSSDGPVIAIDLDDVLCSTNIELAEWHNKVYGTQMTLSDFYYYYYWKNPFWGTPLTTRAKVWQFYISGQMSQARPVPGAREGIEALRALGYRLIIVTARSKEGQADSWAWVERWFPGCFHSMICTGQFLNAPGKPVQDGVGAMTSAHKNNDIFTKLSKAQVCIDIGAKLLIDDSLENALACVNYIPLDGVAKPPPVLLFGSYEWNKRLSLASEERDDMVYDVRFKIEGGKFLDEDVKRGDEALEQANAKYSVRRVKDWSEVVRHVTKVKL